MTLVIDRLKGCVVDRVALAQAEIFKLPADQVHFLLDKERSMHMFIFNDRTAGSRRFYPVNSALVPELGDLVKQYCFIPFRSEQGGLGMMQIHMYSQDLYTRSKRELMESNFAVYTTTRLADSYAFTGSSDIAILPITDQEYVSLLELTFAESIIDSRQHPIFQKYAVISPTDNKSAIDEEIGEKSTMNKSSLDDDYALNIDIDLATINDIL
ncbi:hypothetical protein C3F36_19985 [Aeromonas sp. ASNIH2]|nr:hypothetical protein C3F36_19985 [Aeromonas sp. ASNIH2]TNJ18025.1 hypothetical protein CF113_05995 [Aeromonas veronii]